MLAKKPDKKIASFMLVLLMNAFVPASLSQQQNQWEDHENRQQELTELKRSISKIKEWLGNAQNKQSELVKELRKAELQISNNLRQIQLTEKNIEVIKKQLHALKQKESEQTMNLRQHQQLIAKQVRATYVMGREQGIKLLFNANDPLTLQRVVKYYSYFNQARAQQVAEARQIIIGLEQTKETILYQNQKLIDSRSELTSNQRALEKGRQQRESSLVALNRDVTGKQSRLVEMERNQLRLEELVKEVERTMATIALSEDSIPFAKLRGKLGWPTNGTLMGQTGAAGQSTFRTPGIFFEAPLNQPVSAVHHGRVVFADWLRGFGLLLILDHGDDYMSLYGFNQTLFKDTGDWVVSGEVIASAGNSGGQSQSGLYFEIRHKGKPSDPTKWLQKNITKAP